MLNAKSVGNANESIVTIAITSEIFFSLEIASTPLSQVNANDVDVFE